MKDEENLRLFFHPSSFILHPFDPNAALTALTYV